MKIFSPLLLIIILGLTTCKKYPDGGFVNQTRLHLFGGHHKGDSKTWKLKLYEVNGIDSTYLIPGANTIPEFYDKFIIFTYDGFSTDILFQASTFTRDYRGQIAIKETERRKFSISVKQAGDSLCKKIDNNTYCVRNIFKFSVGNYSPQWKISKLTKKEMVLTSDTKIKIVLNF